MAVLRLAELEAKGREARFPGTSTVFRSWVPFSGINLLGVWNGPIAPYKTLEGANENESRRIAVRKFRSHQLTHA